VPHQEGPCAALRLVQALGQHHSGGARQRRHRLQALQAEVDAECMAGCFGYRLHIQPLQINGQLQGIVETRTTAPAPRQPPQPPQATVFAPPRAPAGAGQLLSWPSCAQSLLLHGVCISDSTVSA